MKTVLRPAAVDDLRAARRYYDEAQPGLGDAFLADLDRLFARLEAFPRSAPLVAGFDHMRRAGLRRFPFGVFYLATDEAIDVLRVVHGTRQSERPVRPE